MTSLWLKPSSSRRFRRGLFSRAGRGGPARLIGIAVAAIAMIGAVVVLSIRHEKPLTDSQVAKMLPMDLLPGGLHSTPAQEALRIKHADAEAEKAEGQAKSYTPTMPGSKPLVVHEAGLDEPPAAVTPDVHLVMPPPPPYTPPENPAPVAREVDPFGSAPKIEKVAATGATMLQDPTDEAALTPERRKAFESAIAQWDIQPMRTTVVLPEPTQEGAAAPARGQGVPAHASVATAAVGGQVLVPAGRGVYAHTILSVNSDAGGPIVLEGDTGPLMGDRMIGSFSKSADDRLVVHITTVEHHGKPIDVAGLVVAPGSMETSVASSIDQHYVERFALPAAAAFVQGLGQAATMSNTTTAVSAYGGVTSSIGPMSLRQQGLIGAGAAAQAVGTALSAATPKGPTAHLDANVSVGVMFLENVVLK